MPPTSKLLLLGLDAGDEVFIREHLDALPNIASIFATGQVNSLSAEPFAGSVWPSFITGGSPDDHGVYHHLQWNPDHMRIERTHPRWIGKIEPFWRQLARAGRRVIAVDVPFLFPGPSGGAFEIANWGSHDLVGAFWSNEAGEAHRILATYGKHPMGFEIPVDKSPDSLLHIRDRIIEGAHLKTRLASDLLASRPWDLFLVVFGELHRAGHMLWPSAGSSGAPRTHLLDVYRAVDAGVGRLLNQAGSDCDVIVFALHGMGSNSSQSHFSRDMLARALRTMTQDDAASAQTGGLVRVLRRSVPAKLQEAIAAAVPLAVRDFVVAREIAGGLPWDRIQVFSQEGDLAGYWRFNLAGREARGITTSDQADRLRTRLAEAFTEFKTPNGQPLVKRMHFPARDLTGPRSHLLPDILAEWDPDVTSADEVQHPTLGVIRGRRTTGRGGNHRFNGYYVHSGPRARAGSGPLPISALGRLVEALVQ